MNYPAISIITPSYNQGQFLEETLLSIINQNYPNLELIVIDGGSTDSSVDIIKKYERHIKYWVSEKDNGQSHAINKGFKIATGDIINWINSDDILTDGALLAVGNIFSQLPDDIGLIHGGTIAFKDQRDLYVDFGYEEVNTERYLAGIAFPQPSAFFLKSLLDEVGFLNEGIHYTMDYDLYSRMILRAKFLKVPEVFSKYRFHQDSKTISQSNKFLDDIIKVFLQRINELKLEWIKAQLKLLGFNSDIFLEEKVIDNILIDIDQRKILFYFLCYVSKLDYSSGNFSRSRLLMNYLTKNYSKAELFSEKEMKNVFLRLNYLPDFLITFLRKLK